MGPAIFVKTDPIARLHRKLFLLSCMRKPLSKNLLLAFLRGLYWWLWLVWWQLMKYVFGKGAKVVPVSRLQHIKDILFLTFWLGIAPQVYVEMRLYHYKRSRWLNFVFPQEQFRWHLSHSGLTTREPFLQIADKFAVEEMLTQENILAARTLARVQRGGSAFEKLLFCRQDLFIKPRDANAMRGCALLKYTASEDRYRLSGYDLRGRKVTSESKEGISAFVAQQGLQHEVLIQENLKNHPAIESFCGVSGPLVTIRVITVMRSFQVKPAYALLEVPSMHGHQWHIYPVNLESGQIRNKPNLPPVTDNKGYLPYWSDIRLAAEKAHRLFPELKTVAWDLCVTLKGVTIIEGNAGWNLVAPQVHTGLPLLESNLLEAYE